MPIRTASFIAGALAALLIAGVVAFVNGPDPWEPDPAAAERLEDTTSDDPTPLERGPDLRVLDDGTLHPADRANLQAFWIEDVCVPATGTPDQCAQHARSDAWPFESLTPLEALAERYSEPGYCDRFYFSDEGQTFCDALAAHYAAGEAGMPPLHAEAEATVTAPPADVANVLRAVDPGALVDGHPYVWDAEIAPHLDAICAWLAAQEPRIEQATGQPSPPDYNAAITLRAAINSKSDGLAAMVGHACLGEGDPAPPWG